VNLYFIRLNSQQQKIFDYDLPNDFLLPIASDKSFEEVYTNFGTLEIINGLLLAVNQHPEHPSYPYWIKIIQNNMDEILSVISVAIENSLSQKNFHGAEHSLNFLKRIVSVDQFALKLLEARLYDEMAKDFAQNENWEEAKQYKIKTKELYQELLYLESQNPQVLKFAGLFYSSIGDYEKVIELWGRYLEKVNDDEQLRKAYQDLVNAQEEDRLFKLVYDKIMLEQEAESLVIVEELLKRRSDSWQAWFLKGWANRRLENFSAAIECFEKCLMLNPNHVDSLIEKGLCHYSLDQIDIARQIWERVLDLEPMNGKVLFNLGIVSLKLGESEDARYYFKAYLELHPNDHLVLNLLRELDIKDK